ncbi:MAG: ribosomal-processing cysteine protease Prp [Firmicutes bacterium]|jgi:uncharacterized protein YsxB (DUF464 family)|nr:ribosomal-processing cysteine protease Prp [Bacillota bacterium]
MITITLWRLSNGNISGFVVDGHAAYAPKGQDIVCAAVSALAQAAVLGLTKHVGLNPEVEIREGHLCCMVTASNAADRAVQAILATLALALQDIAAQYPNRIRCKEVQS